MREIIVVRKKGIIACLAKAVVYIDGIEVGCVKNGQTIKLSIDDNAHDIFVSAAGTKPGNILRICEGNQNITFYMKFGVNGFLLVPEKNEAEEFSSLVCPVPPPLAPPKSQAPSIFCGSIIALICLILSLALYLNNQTSLIGLIAGIILALASGVVIIWGGFWIIIIPLPFIYLFKWGCQKPNQSIKAKITLSILAFVLPIISVLMLFILRGI